MKMSASSVKQEPTKSGSNKIGAVYQTEEGAHIAVQELKRDPGLYPESISVVSPEHQVLETKLDSKGKQIWYTAVRTQIMMGLAGVAFGLIIAFLLTITGIQMDATNIIYTFGVSIVLGGFLGMMVGGTFALSPEHDLILYGTNQDTENGQWFVVVHADTDHQKQIALTYFNQSDKQSVFTL